MRRARVWVIALSFAAIGLSLSSLLWWRAMPPRPRRLDPSPSSEAATPEPPAPVVSTNISPPAAGLSPSAVPSDAEALLRQLEPLAIADKPRALELALRGDSRLPATGVLAEARRALIVTLLVDLDRMPEARARAERFTLEYPASGYLPLVQGVTGFHPRPRPSELRDAH